MNPTPSHPPACDEPDRDYRADHLNEDLRWAVSLVEDWLLHASPETLDELADFAYGPTHHGHDHLRWITDMLGEAAARLRPAPLPGPPEPATAEREPSR
jgi:hypothetical protein